jgi:dCMP deaminase
MSIDEHGHQWIEGVEQRRPMMTIRIIRPAADFLMLEWAKLASGRSTCQRAKVGAVLTDTNMLQVLAYGYNGNARGMPNACDRPDDPGSCGCIHAEANALIKAPGIVEKFLFTSVAPCLACAKLAVNAFVVRVYFANPYRDTSGLALLMAAGVPAYQLDAFGRCVWRSAFDSLDQLKEVELNE